MAEVNVFEKLLEALKSIDEKMRWCETLDPTIRRQVAKMQRDLEDKLRIEALTPLTQADLSMLQRLNEVEPLMNVVKSATCNEKKTAENIKQAVEIVKQVAGALCKYLP